MRALIGRDEPWPFFHFWRHHFWPKLASSLVNFCRKRRSIQWCPDQSDRATRAWDMHKNAQKVEQKTQKKISCHYMWLLHGKSCPSRWRFLKTYPTASKPIRRLITAAKKKLKGEKGKARKKNSKIRKTLRRRSLSRPKTQNFDFCACPSQNVIKRDASGKKAKLSWCKSRD